MLWQVSCPNCSMRSKSAGTGTTPSRSSATPSPPTPWIVLAAGGSRTRIALIDPTAPSPESARYKSKCLYFLSSDSRGQSLTAWSHLTGWSNCVFTCCERNSAESVCLAEFAGKCNEYLCSNSGSKPADPVFPTLFFICCPLCWHFVSRIYFTGSLTQKLIRLHWFEFQSEGEIASFYQCLLNGDSQLQCQSSVTKRCWAFFPNFVSEEVIRTTGHRGHLSHWPPPTTTCTFKPHTYREAS